MKEVCCLCRFWKKNPNVEYRSIDGVEQETYFGECHCNPPQKNGHFSQFPTTNASDWCGCFVEGKYGNV